MFFAVAIPYFVWLHFKDEEYRKELQKRGVYVHAQVNSARYFKGDNTLKFSFKYKEKLYNNSGGTKDFSIREHDSILIVVLPEDLEGHYLLVKKL